jgi:hypothetical protein
MRPKAKFGSMFGPALWAASLLLIVTLSAGSPACNPGESQHAIRPSHEPFPAGSPSRPADASNHRKVTQYVMDLDGDHSLDVATVVEQSTNGYSHYTVQLRLASGAEQSIAFVAPPGGLQIEMHDMTGDKIRNDLVLRPAWIRRLPTVVLNDGHDHFSVAISAPDPGSLSSGQQLASEGRGDQGTFALLSSGFKSADLKHLEALFIPQVQQEFFGTAALSLLQWLSYSLDFGRAPPPLVLSA